MDKEDRIKLLEKCNLVFDIYSKKINSIDAEVEQLERRIKKLKKERADSKYTTIKRSARSFMTHKSLWQ